MLKDVIVMDFIVKIFARYYPKYYLCVILVFFVRKRLRIKMGQMVTERGNHLFLYIFQSIKNYPFSFLISHLFLLTLSEFFFTETFIRQKYLWQI